MPRDDYARLHDDYVRRELQIAFDQADRGEWEDLDIEAVIAEPRQSYSNGAEAAS